MTVQQIEDGSAQTVAPEQVERALASFLRAELEVPAHDVSGFIDLLMEDAARDGLGDLLPDLGKMRAASGRLETMVAELLGGVSDTLPTNAADRDAVSAKLRHDLRTPLTAIIGYGELLGEEAREGGAAQLAETLDGLIGASKRLLDQIDVLVDLMRAPGPAEIGEARPTEAAHLMHAAETIRAVLLEAPDLAPRVRGRILVVDDNASNLDLLSRRLERDGHAVTVCETGEGALSRLAEGVFDLVLLDLVMPGLNGIDVLRILRGEEKTRLLPVIMVSAMDEVDGAVRCIEAGADDFLAKPLNPILLRARLNAALDRKVLRDREIEITARLKAERERSETLLRNVLPGSIVERLRRGETVIADHLDAVTILFCDLVGFTRVAGVLPPAETLALLNGIFSEFDAIADRHGLEKIKTIGDAYMVAGGLPEAMPDHAAAATAMALRMPAVVAQASRAAGRPLACRIGMHTGPAVAGIIGTHKFVYDVWGDTVNIASRMERYGTPGRVHITREMRDALGALYAYESLPPKDIKGKGMMDTFLIVP